MSLDELTEQGLLGPVREVFEARYGNQPAPERIERMRYRPVPT